MNFMTNAGSKIVDEVGKIPGTGVEKGNAHIKYFPTDKMEGYFMANTV